MNTVALYDFDKVTDWESLCSCGQSARVSMDNWRWYVGDLACRVVKLYPPRDGVIEHTLDEFSKAINVMKKSLYQYRQVASFYDALSTRLEYIEKYENLTYTHFRLAMRMGEALEAYDFLDHASAQGWTTDETAHHIAEQLGKVTTPPLVEGEMSIDAAIEALTHFDAQRQVKIVVKDVTS